MPSFTHLSNENYRIIEPLSLEKTTKIINPRSVRVIYWPYQWMERIERGQLPLTDHFLWAVCMRLFPSWCQDMNLSAVIHQSCSLFAPGSSRRSSRWGWNVLHLNPDHAHSLGHARGQDKHYLHFLHHEVVIRIRGQDQSWIFFFFPLGFRCLNAFGTAPLRNQSHGLYLEKPVVQQQDSLSWQKTVLGSAGFLACAHC